MFLCAGKLEEAASMLNIARYILNPVLKGVFAGHRRLPAAKHITSIKWSLLNSQGLSCKLHIKGALPRT